MSETISKPSIISRVSQAALNLVLQKHERELLETDEQLRSDEQIAGTFREKTYILNKNRQQWPVFEERVQGYKNANVADLLFEGLDLEYSDLNTSAQRALPSMIICMNADSILEKGRKKWLDDPAEELAAFTKKHSATLKRLGLI